MVFARSWIQCLVKSRANEVGGHSRRRRIISLLLVIVEVIGSRTLLLYFNCSANGFILWNLFSWTVLYDAWKIMPHAIRLGAGRGRSDIVAWTKLLRENVDEQGQDALAEEYQDGQTLGSVTDYSGETEWDDVWASEERSGSVGTMEYRRDDTERSLWDDPLQHRSVNDELLEGDQRSRKRTRSA